MLPANLEPESLLGAGSAVVRAYEEAAKAAAAMDEMRRWRTRLGDLGAGPRGGNGALINQTAYVDRPGYREVIWNDDGTCFTDPHRRGLDALKAGEPVGFAAWQLPQWARDELFLDITQDRVVVTGDQVDVLPRRKPS